MSRTETATRSRATGPLAGVRVLDLTTILLGPLATQILGDMGADVIKVESPAGDPIRDVGPAPTDGLGAVFIGTNRNKRSLVLDLKQASARDALLALARGADVFVHNMRPHAVAKLGLAYDDVAAVNPRIVYCGAYGFAERGPYGRKPAFDDMIQAASGLAALQAGDGEPRYVTSAVVDKITALTVVYAVAMALFHRERSGEGQLLEVPMFETMVSFNMVEHLYGLTYDPPRGRAGYPRTLSADRRPYATRDGHIGVLPYTDRQWRAFFALAGRPELAGDERFRTMGARIANIDALYAEVSRLLGERTTAEWLAALDDANVPAMPVNQPDALLDDAHLAATGFWETREDAALGRLRFPGIAPRLSRSPGAIRRVAPRLGEHSTQVLREAGIEEARIEALLASGAAVQGGGNLEDRDRGEGAG